MAKQLKENLHRKSEEQFIASSVAQMRNYDRARNLFIHGPVGVGKTGAVKNILAQARKQNIKTVYVNCCRNTSTLDIATEMCLQLNHNRPKYMRADKVLDKAVSLLKKKKVILVFDDIDKAISYDFLYAFLEGLKHKAIFLISNSGKLANLDPRLTSRLMLSELEFKPLTV